MKNNVPPKVRKFPAAKQRRLDQFLDKNSDGKISPSEAATLKQFVAEAEQLMVANAKLLAKFFKAEATRGPVGAVPVTVWVQRVSQHAEP
jgi:hypothetical protein